MKTKFKRKIWMFFASLFYGMKAGNDMLNKQIDPGSPTTISQNQTADNVFSDFVNGYETQRVKEARDSYYRVIRESEKYHVDIDSFKIGKDGDFEGDEISAKARKKTASDLLRHVDVYNDDNLPIKVIQDNIHFEKETMFTPDLEAAIKKSKKVEDYDYFTLLNVVRNGFAPIFPIEKLITKIVVKENDAKTSFVELSVPTIPPQFAPIAGSVLNKMRNIVETKRFRDSLIASDGFKFFTEKPWSSNGCHSGEEFEYKNPVVVDVFVYDGSYIIKYKCDIVTEFKYVGDKYKTKEMTEKYDNFAPKGDAANLYAAERLNKYKERKNDSSN